MSHGCVLGWLSPFLPLLQSDNSPLRTGPISLVEASWVGAVICIGGVIGNFSFGLLVSRFGSKRGISLLAFPQMVSSFANFLNRVRISGIYLTSERLTGILVICDVRTNRRAFICGSNVCRNDGRWNIYLYSAVRGRNL